MTLKRKPDRWMLTSDDDGHWYCIPAKLYDLFVRMLEDGESDSFASFCNKFSTYSIGGGPTLVTFENPKW